MEPAGSTPVAASDAGIVLAREESARVPLLRALLELLHDLAVAALFCFFLIAFVAQAFRVQGTSMQPLLADGERIIVNKFVYRFHPIERSDVVVFWYPREPQISFIKRVVGLPGETVEIRNKTVFINGGPLDEKAYVHFLEPPLKPGDPEFGLRGNGLRDNWGPQVVPPGMLFVLGDNRDNSRDSRFWKFLPRDQVKGRALLVYWSYEASREEYHRTGYAAWIRDTVAALGKTRWTRFFHLIR